jgi:O-antigen/teichoic acid export membrane protein
MVHHKRLSRIVRNFGSLALGKTVGDGFTFLLFVVLSRVFGQEGVGHYSFAMALTGFFMVLADFGLYNFSVKEMSRWTGDLGAYYGGIFSVRLVLGTTSLVLMLLLVPFLSLSYEAALAIVLIGAYQVFYTWLNGFAAIFVAREEMHFAGLLELSLRMLTALVSIGVVMAGGSLGTALAVLPIVTFGHLFAAYYLVVRKYGAIQLKLSWSYLTHTLHEAVPYALFIFLRQLSTRTDVILLGFFLSAAAVGVYNAAYRIAFLFMFLSYFIGLTLFPLASRLYVHSRQELATLYHRSLNLVILIALPLAFGLWLVAPDLIHLIFGEDFTGSVSVLRYLTWLIFIMFVKSIMGVFLTSCDRQTERTKGQWIAVWVNVIGNIILIPTLGVKGAAITVLLSESLLVLLFAMRLRDLVGWPRVGSRLVMGAMGTAATCLPFIVRVPTLPLGLAISTSVLLYVSILTLFKEIRQNEIRALLGLLRGGVPTEGV